MSIEYKENAFLQKNTVTCVSPERLPAEWVSAYQKALSDGEASHDGLVLLRWDGGEKPCVLVTDGSTCLCAVSEEVAPWKPVYKSCEEAILDYAAQSVLREGERLTAIEQELARLEGELMSGTSNPRASIVLIRSRRQLFALQKRCEQARSALTRLEDKGVRGEESAAQYAHLATQAKELQEYMTQVRDAYQAHLGLKQNNLMRTFTVIASIFMPLQLVTGWYGMNLVMPEVPRPLTYWVVIGVCLVTVVISLLLFRKKRWL